MLSITVNEKIFKKWSDRRFWAILLNVQFVCHRSWVCPRLCHGFKKGRINKCNNSTKIYEYVIIIIITQSVVTYSCCSYFMVTVTSSVLSLAVNAPLPSHNECTGGGSATLWCCCTNTEVVSRSTNPTRCVAVFYSVLSMHTVPYLHKSVVLIFPL